MFLMYQPFKKLSGSNTSIQQGLISAERVFQILDTPSDVQERPDARPAPAFSREIEFHDVSFGYEDKLVLKNINLKIKAGQMVALVGMSGVGKSTLADLVPRFYDATAGKITLDGVDIRDVTLGFASFADRHRHPADFFVQRFGKKQYRLRRPQQGHGPYYRRRQGGLCS